MDSLSSMLSTARRIHGLILLAAHLSSAGIARAPVDARGLILYGSVQARRAGGALT